MKQIHTLKIDDEFKYLIRPLSSKELLQLEENILANGCLNPIVVWNETIIDGHNRYAICQKHNIPFDVFKKTFDSREEAISWICKNQLGRRNITEETRRYLIGRQYESEKIILAKRNASGRNQYSTTVPQNETTKKRNKHKTAMRIGEDNNVSYGTVQKYGSLAKAIEGIRTKCPELALKILSGKYKVCQDNIIALSDLSRDSLNTLNGKIERNNKPLVEYSKTKNIISANVQKSVPSIKDMPSFDPDAILSELYLTIPSWISSINRVKNNADFQKTTESGKKKLKNELEHLKNATICLLSVVSEKNNE